MEIKVSIIIAAYNIEKYIEKCLESVVNQTFKNLEIIVVNDGSTDNTLKQIESFKEMDERIIIINQENMGIIEARKTGFNSSTGKYILFIDGDDWLELDCIEKLYNKAIVEDIDILLFNFFFSYDDNRRVGRAFNYEKEEVILNPLKSLFLDDIYPSFWTKFIRRNYIIDNNVIFPSNISFAEDLAAVSSLFISKPNIGTIKENLYNYYQRKDSITKQVNNKILEMNEAILFIKGQLLKSNIYNNIKDEFEMMIYSNLFVIWFLGSDITKDVRKEVYKQYKKYKISIRNNNYIKEFIRNKPLSLRVRMKIYDKNYYLGNFYDFIRKVVLVIIEKN